MPHHPSLAPAALLNTLHDLVAFPSYTLDLEAVRLLQQHLAERCEQLGFEARFHELPERAPILELECAGDVRSPKPPIVLLAHADVAYPYRGAGWRVEGDSVYGAGVLDLKAGIVCILAALEALQQQTSDFGPIRVLINSCEENPTAEAGAVIAAGCEDALAVLVCEYGREQGGLILSRKGRLVGEFTSTGAARHAGNTSNPFEDNAIVKLGEVLKGLENLQAGLSGVQINPGSISGGDRQTLNIVPAEASVCFEARFTAARQAQLSASLHALANSLGCSLEIPWLTPARAASGAAQELYQRVESVSQELQLPCTMLEEVGGLSDLNFVPSDVPAVDALGPCGSGAHQEGKECVSLKSLERCAQRLFLLLQRL